MTSRRAIILVFILGVTFLIAATLINAVIAEALFLPSGVALPRQLTRTVRRPGRPRLWPNMCA